MLPPYEGKSILELGAGIGRFTGELAQKAGQLLALDFIDSVIKKVNVVDSLLQLQRSENVAVTVSLTQNYVIFLC